MVTITVFQAIYILIAFALLLIGCYTQIWWIKKGYNDKFILTEKELGNIKIEMYDFGYENGQKRMRQDIFNFEQTIRTINDEDCD